ncbi:uncharacterized protein LOC119678384 [Teleopsis dalmanni]|uniref:uncharacterized protein LOC119678384 n=1 Tax=Teleopsis dalmanni TaxID=139649 RepID=UPI0018CE2C5E|nr:uncharacterized protein LOC119678384 [Teleopsis dalmanni]
MVETVPVSSKTPLKLPNWLQASLFEDNLKKNVPNYKSIKNFQVQEALKAGENFATQMLQIEIEVTLLDDKTKTVSFMLKLPHDSIVFKHMLKLHNVFYIESSMYTEIIPELEALYRDAGLEVKFGPEFYKLKSTENYILLEDLRPRGFKNANRLEGFDTAHTSCTLKKLAQYHAASATRVAVKGPYPDLYNIGFYTEANHFFIDQMNDSIAKHFRESMITYQGYETYKESVEQLQSKLTDDLYKITKVDASEFNVLNHGDFWCNNIMFQYDAFGKIKETYFVDFQLPKYGSPSQDLFYILISSTQFDIKLKQFDYFIKYYHEHLIEHLKLLNYPKQLPTLRDLQLQLCKYGLWGYLTATGVMGTVLMESTEDSEAKKILGDAAAGERFKRLALTNDRYRKHIEPLMQWLLNRGALE